MEPNMSQTNTTAGSNSIAMNLPTNADIRKQVTLALTEADKANGLGNSAVQRMAYAIMCIAAGLGDHPLKVASLAVTLTSPDARKDVKAAMVAQLLPAPTDTKQLSEDRTGAVKADRTAAMAMVDRGLKLAALMANTRVEYTAFNAKLGQFMVPSTLFCTAGETPRGRIAKAAAIYIDNASISVETHDAQGEPKTMHHVASVARIFKANTKAKPRATAGNAGDGNADARKSGDAGKAGTLPVPALVKELHAILCAKDADKSEPVRKDAYPNAVWNQLADLLTWYNDTSKSETFNTKAPAMRNKRDAA